MDITREMLKSVRTNRRLLTRIKQEKIALDIKHQVCGEWGGDDAQLEKKLSAEIEKLTKKVSATEKFIRSYDDAYIGRIMQYRYLDGLSWSATAIRVGGGNTADSLRMAVGRSLMHHGIK